MIDIDTDIDTDLLFLHLGCHSENTKQLQQSCLTHLSRSTFYSSKLGSLGNFVEHADHDEPLLGFLNLADKVGTCHRITLLNT